MLNFDELHFCGIKCFHLFGIAEGKNQRCLENSLENFSLYLLGHLRAKNQRSGKNLSLIRNFKGVKFNRFAKILKILQRKRHLPVQQVSVDRCRYSIVRMWAALLKMGALIPCYSSKVVRSSNNVVKSFDEPTIWAGL